MGLTKYKLGRFIERVERRNSDLQYGIDDVRGVSNTKEIQPTKADISERSFTRFQIVERHEFVFNRRTTRMGEKIGLGYNNIDEVFIVTEDYVVFRVTDESVLLPDYLNIFFRRPEFDRYARWDSWGSATEFFNWEEMCDVPISIPPIPIQQKYIDVYNAMLVNQRSYESGLEDLKLVCDGYIENLRKKKPCEKIGKYIHQKNDRNRDKSIDRVMGLSTKKAFREAQSRVNRDELGNYKIVRPYDIAFVPTTDTWKVLAFAVNTFNADIVISPVYEVFSVDSDILLPQYLAIWLSRTEFDRYARYHSWGSARENFSFEDMCDVKIPIPNIDVQNDIVDIYNAYIMRREINEKLKAQIKDLSPILIKGSLEEASA